MATKDQNTSNHNGGERPSPGSGEELLKIGEMSGVHACGASFTVLGRREVGDENSGAWTRTVRYAVSAFGGRNT